MATREDDPPPGVRPGPCLRPHIVAIEKGWLEEASFTEIETATFTSGAAAGEARSRAKSTQDARHGAAHQHAAQRHPIVIVPPARLPMSRSSWREPMPGLRSLKTCSISNRPPGSSTAPLLSRISRRSTVSIHSKCKSSTCPARRDDRADQQRHSGVHHLEPVALSRRDERGCRCGNPAQRHHQQFPVGCGEEAQISFTRSVWVLSEDFIRDYPNTARALMLTLYRAQDYVAVRRTAKSRGADFGIPRPAGRAERSAVGRLFVREHLRRGLRARPESYTEFLQLGSHRGKLDPMDYTYTGYMAEYDPSGSSSRATGSRNRTAGAPDHARLAPSPSGSCLP